jgi:ligand-binding SRPBCC domain-containing protein
MDVKSSSIGETWMKIYQMEHTQHLNVSLEEAWEYFSNPVNLSDITPSWLCFRINSSLPEKIYPGLILTYQITPIAGIPITWATEITYVKENEYFVDEQRIGPYAFWHHFRQLSNNVEMTDIVHYSLPFGIIGRLLHPFLVKDKVKDIFQYRRKKIKKLFLPIGEN